MFHIFPLLRVLPIAIIGTGTVQVIGTGTVQVIGSKLIIIFFLLLYSNIIIIIKKYFFFYRPVRTNYPTNSNQRQALLV